MPLLAKSLVLLNSVLLSGFSTLTETLLIHPLPIYENMNSNEQILYCDPCINLRLANLKKLKEQREREEKIKAEQEQINYSNRMAELEREALSESRKSLIKGTALLAKDLEEKKAKRNIRSLPQTEQSNDIDYYKEFETRRNKYREELLSQINEKQSRKTELERAEREAEKKRLEDIETEKQRSIKELENESLIQREVYKHSLAQQVFEKNSKKAEELYQKQVERVLLDEQVRKHQEDQRKLLLMIRRGVDPNDKESNFYSQENDHFSSCSSCKKLLPIKTLSKFPS